MKRKFTIYQSSTTYERRHFCIDNGNADEILAFMEDEKIRDKIEYIINRVLEQRFIYYDDYVSIGDDISEMRIFPNGINARLYCKEVKTAEGTFYIIAAKVLPKKKSNKINKELKQFINPIKKYEYEF